MMRNVHWFVTVDYQQIANGNIANQIHRFTIVYSKFILIIYIRKQKTRIQMHTNSNFGKAQDVFTRKYAVKFKKLSPLTLSPPKATYRFYSV